MLVSVFWSQSSILTVCLQPSEHESTCSGVCWVCPFLTFSQAQHKKNPFLHSLTAISSKYTICSTATLKDFQLSLYFGSFILTYSKVTLFTKFAF